MAPTVFLLIYNIISKILRTTVSYRSPPSIFMIPAVCLMRRAHNEYENTAKGPYLKPRMNLYEDPKNNLVLAEIELSGFKDVAIDVQSGCLAITAESKLPENVQEDNYAIRERLQGQYSRTNIIPQASRPKMMNLLRIRKRTSMEYGLLQIAFSKSAPKTASRKISIA